MGSLCRDAPPIIDLATKSTACDLRLEILRGLEAQPPVLPELLLWNDVGQQLFEAFSLTPTYYPKALELEILTTRAEAMARDIPSGSTLIEFGCGSLQKTGILLAACERLDRHITYYALDVSQHQLNEALHLLQMQFLNSSAITIKGLRGTYEEGAEWLATHSRDTRPPAVVVLWMGNSMANLPRSEAQRLLARLGRAEDVSGVPCRFLVALDGQDDEHIIRQAYDPDIPVHRDFLLNGLVQANNYCGKELFCSSTWTCETVFVPSRYQLEVNYVSNKDLTLEIGEGHSVPITQGQRVRVLNSGKWPRGYLECLVREIGLQVTRSWTDKSTKYGEHHPSSECACLTQLAFHQLSRAR